MGDQRMQRFGVVKGIDRDTDQLVDEDGGVADDARHLCVLVSIGQRKGDYRTRYCTRWDGRQGRTFVRLVALVAQ